MKDLWEGPGGTLISMREAMRRLHFPKDAIYRLVAAGELDDFRYRESRGWHWIYLDSVEAYKLRHARRFSRAPKKSISKARRRGKK